MSLQILLVWAKGNPSPADMTAVKDALDAAQNIYKVLTFDIFGHVNLKEEGILPNNLGYDEDQDSLDATADNYDDIIKIRDLYLYASNREGIPVFVLFVVPANDLVGANGFALLSQYCAVLPIPTGAYGTADGHTYAHEIGHGLGLEHVNEKSNLMYPYRRTPEGLSGDELRHDQLIIINNFLRANLSFLTK